MSITALPLDPGARARALLHHLLQTGDAIGRDQASFSSLLTTGFSSSYEHSTAVPRKLEDAGDDEPDECRMLIFG